MNRSEPFLWTWNISSSASKINIYELSQSDRWWGQKIRPFTISQNNNACGINEIPGPGVFHWLVVGMHIYRLTIIHVTLSKEWLDKMKKTRHDFYVLTWLLLSSQTTTTCQTRQHWNYIYGGLWPFVAWVLYARWWGLKYIPIIFKRLTIWKYICTNLFLNRSWHNWEQPIILKFCLAIFFSLCRVVEGRVLRPNNISSFWAILASGVFSFLWKLNQKKKFERK